jgi:hypothetical protein
MKIRLIGKLPLMLIAVAVFSSCKKDNNQSQDVAAHDVYVAGAAGDTAVYWKNGNIKYLSDGTTPSQAYSITAASNSDTYIAGYVSVNNSYAYNNMAVYWKNGVINFLTNGHETSSAVSSSIFVSGRDVYVFGYEDDPSRETVYWKNDSVNHIQGTPYSAAAAMFVSGTDIYFAALTSGDSATFWKNGIPTTVPIKSGAITNVFFASGNDVYTAGYYFANGQGNGVYSKNNTINIITDNTPYLIVTSIFVSGNDIYVGGYESVNNAVVATYWKNGVPVHLSTTHSNLLSLYVLGNDVYATGVEYDVTGSITSAVVWKNGVENKIGGKDSIGNSIFVK